jgi:hypothetical protein
MIILQVQFSHSACWYHDESKTPVAWSPERRCNPWFGSLAKSSKEFPTILFRLLSPIMQPAQPVST